MNETLNYTKDEITVKVRDIVAGVMGINASDMKLEASISESTGAESLDFLDIAYTIETEFNIMLEKKSALERYMDLVDRDKVVQNGLVTDLGMAVLRKVFVEMADTELAGHHFPINRITSLFTINTYVRVVEETLSGKKLTDEDFLALYQA